MDQRILKKTDLKTVGKGTGAQTVISLFKTIKERVLSQRNYGTTGPIVSRPTESLQGIIQRTDTGFRNN